MPVVAVARFYARARSRRAHGIRAILKVCVQSVRALPGRRNGFLLNTLARAYLTWYRSPGGDAAPARSGAVLATTHLKDFRLDASSDSLVVETDPDLAAFRRASARYGGAEFLIVTFEPGDLFADPSIDTLAS